MNPNYVSRTLCFHGQPLQKIWDDERGVEDLRQMRIIQPNYSVYLERQKFFTFQERAKRLKLHQFLARKAEDLFDSKLVAYIMEDQVLEPIRKHIAQLPPYELCLDSAKSQDKPKCSQYIYRLSKLKPADIIYGYIVKTFPVGSQRIVVKPLCTEDPNAQFLEDIPIKATVYPEHLGLLPFDTQGNPISYKYHDYIRCEIVEVNCDAERMTIGLAGVMTHGKIKLGLIDYNELPETYRRLANIAQFKYEDELEASLEFENPNYESLYLMNGLNVNDNFSLMSTLKYDYPREEYANELRAKQANTWAFHYVAEGIERFKNGQQVEAFQCLNKALNIDPRNVEGLVARGALYANKGSFLKAIEDFEKALSLNSFHVNARKYMGETLVALGHSYEEEQRIPDAIKAYRDCLNLIPNHEQASISLDALVSEDNNSVVVVPETTQSQHLSSESDTKEQPPYSQPFYAMPIMNNHQPHSSSRSSINEFKLDDDDTATQVRKLIRDASKHRKSKKKSEKERGREKIKKKNNKKSKNESDLESIEYMQKLDFDQAYRMMQTTDGVFDSRQQHNDNFSLYEDTFLQPKRQEATATSTTVSFGIDSSSDGIYNNKHFGNQTSPRPASVKLSNYENDDQESRDSSPAPPPPKITKPQKLSFQIKRPVVVDKFGLVRVATPLNLNRSSSRSPSPSDSPTQFRTQRSRDFVPSRRFISPSRSRSRSRGRRTSYALNSRSKSRGRRPSPAYVSGRRRSHSRSRSYERYGYNNRRDRSPCRSRYSRSRTPERYNKRRGGGGGSRVASRISPASSRHRRSPSPFVPRGTPSPQSRFRRSRSSSIDERPRHRQRQRSPRSPRRSYRGGHYNSNKKFGNRVWQRSRSPNFSNRSNETKSSTEHRRSKEQTSKTSSTSKEPTIEEIDEIINKAQKERKQEIISRDKNILKKTTGGGVED